jgi:hypothetical protein
MPTVLISCLAVWVIQSYPALTGRAYLAPKPVEASQQSSSLPSIALWLV